MRRKFLLTEKILSFKVILSLLKREVNMDMAVLLSLKVYLKGGLGSWFFKQVYYVLP